MKGRSMRRLLASRKGDKRSWNGLLMSGNMIRTLRFDEAARPGKSSRDASPYIGTRRLRQRIEVFEREGGRNRLSPMAGWIPLTPRYVFGSIRIRIQAARVYAGWGVCGLDRSARDCEFDPRIILKAIGAALRTCGHLVRVSSCGFVVRSNDV